MAQEIRFELNGVTYTQTAKGYCFKSAGTFDKKGQELSRRIGKHIWEQAFGEYIAQVNEADEEWDTEAEVETRKDAEEAKDRETEAKFNKKAEKKAVKRTRKSKDIAHESNGVTITAKQVEFMTEMTKTNLWKNGLESALWCDILADEIGGQFADKPMTVGAMISTLREKNLINVSKDNSRKGHPKFMVLTEIGKRVAKELGLN